VFWTQVSSAKLPVHRHTNMQKTLALRAPKNWIATSHLPIKNGRADPFQCPNRHSTSGLKSFSEASSCVRNSKAWLVGSIQILRNTDPTQCMGLLQFHNQKNGLWIFAKPVLEKFGTVNPDETCNLVRLVTTMYPDILLASQSKSIPWQSLSYG